MGLVTSATYNKIYTALFWYTILDKLYALPTRRLLSARHSLFSMHIHHHVSSANWSSEFPFTRPHDQEVRWCLPCTFFSWRIPLLLPLQRSRWRTGYLSRLTLAYVSERKVALSSPVEPHGESPDRYLHGPNEREITVWGLPGESASGLVEQLTPSATYTCFSTTRIPYWLLHV